MANSTIKRHFEEHANWIRSLRAMHDSEGGYLGGAEIVGDEATSPFGDTHASTSADGVFDQELNLDDEPVYRNIGQVAFTEDMPEQEVGFELNEVYRSLDSVDWSEATSHAEMGWRASMPPLLQRQKACFFSSL